MIQSFADRDTEELFESERNHRFAALSRVALRKLIQMNQAGALSDLAVLCGTRAEIPLIPRVQISQATSNYQKQRRWILDY